MNKQLAFVFPGQGSQQVGMLSSLAKDFPIIEATFEEASKALGMDLWHLTQQGPIEQLNDTQNTQPALLAAGVALWRLWHDKRDDSPAFLAGHSLGEYTALVCANALSFEDAIKLVALRGRYMQEAVPKGSGAMAAIIGLDDTLLEQICVEAQQGEVVLGANYNSPAQTVIAGDVKAVERACALAKEKGAKRALLLPVSVPSHCSLMQSAAEKLKEALSDLSLSTPDRVIIHNVDVSAAEQPEDIRERLVMQLSKPVRWVETIQALKSFGVEHIVECGPGKVLSGLIKRIDKTLETTNIMNAADLECALENGR